MPQHARVAHDLAQVRVACPQVDGSGQGIGEHVQQVVAFGGDLFHAPLQDQGRPQPAVLGCHGQVDHERGAHGLSPPEHAPLAGGDHAHALLRFTLQQRHHQRCVGGTVHIEPVVLQAQARAAAQIAVPERQDLFPILSC